MTGLWTIVIFGIMLCGFAEILRTQRRLSRDLVELDRVVRLIATQWQMTLPPRSEEIELPAGQFLHWENYPIKPEMPDAREVEKET